MFETNWTITATQQQMQQSFLYVETTKVELFDLDSLLIGIPAISSRFTIAKQNGNDIETDKQRF